VTNPRATRRRGRRWVVERRRGDVRSIRMCIDLREAEMKDLPNTARGR